MRIEIAGNLHWQLNRKMKLEKNNTYGIIGTIVVHGIVLLILLLFCFAPPKVEFPEPDGILVDFGDLVVGDNTGAESPSSVTEPVSAQPEVNDAPTVTQTEVPSIPVKTNKNKVEETKTPELSPEEQERIRQEAEFKAKMDNFMKQMLLLNDSVVAQSREYTNSKHKDIEPMIEGKLQPFNDKIFNSDKDNFFNIILITEDIIVEYNI